MSRRVTRVCELLRRELGGLLQRDFSFPGALVTVNEVDMTPDLKQAHVYLGIIGSEEERGKALRAIQRRRAQLQEQLGHRVVLKYTPQLHFRVDDSIERGVRVLNLIDQIELPPEDGEAEEPAKDE